MPIKLRNANLLPPTDVETIEVLGLHIPMTGDLPFGAQVEWFDLAAAQEEGRVGGMEFMMRAFCLFTRRLPKREWVKYEDLASKHLHPDDVAELFQGIAALMNALKPETPDDGDSDGGGVGEGNAPRRGKSKK